MSICNNIHLVKTQITLAEQASHRAPDSVLLVAVSKKQNQGEIREAYYSGISHFAENYLQEAQKKMGSLKELPLIWHFIGPIQSNKAKAIATQFAWVHSINRQEIALALNEYRSDMEQPLQVCLQINLIQEKSKAGISKEGAAELALLVSRLPHIKLRGLMTLPPANLNEQESYALFSELKRLLDDLNKQFNLQMDTLSMGMSDDYLPAIKAGATLVRIGRAIFGERI